METIASGDIHWLGERRLDPLGPRFILKSCSEDKLYFPRIFFRAVHRSQLEIFWRLYNKESVKRSFRAGLIAEEKPIESMRFSGPDAELYSIILEAPSLGKPPTISEITFERRVRMAKLWVEINQQIAKDELCLIDAHLNNFAFDDSFKPVWIDFGSVRELSQGHEGFEEFRATHLRPLRLAARSPEAIEIFLSFAISRKVKVSLRLGRIRKIMDAPFLRSLILTEDLFMKAVERLGFVRTRKHLVTRYRKMMLNKFRRQLDRLPKPAPTTGHWSKYTDNGNPSARISTRAKRIKQLVSQLQPKSIIDVGANDGWLILQNLDVGRHLCAVDPDHGALSRFTSRLEDILLPHGTQVRAAIGGFGPRDHKHELVVALALTHHLALSQGWSFEAIARVLDSLTNKYALVEFMPDGLAGNSPHPRAILPDWYSEENFLFAMRSHFETVLPVYYQTEPQSSRRLLYLCKKP